MNIVSRIHNHSQRGFLRSAAAWVFGWLLLITAQFSVADLTTTITNIAYMSSMQIPGPVAAQANITATLTNVNNSTISFDQNNILLEQGVTSLMTLTITNTGINNLVNGSIVITLPAGVIPTFPVDPLYTFVQQLDGSWLISFVNPILPNAIINIPIQLDLQPGAPEGAGQITAHFSANSVLIDSASAGIIVGKVTSGLFLVHQVDKNVVEHDETLMYSLSVTNQLTIDVDSIYLTNVLPMGVRFIKGTVKINNIPVADPVVSADGRSLIFNIGTLEADETAIVTYAAYVTSVVHPGILNSTSIAQGSNAISNKASVEVVVRQDAINVDSHVLGRVLVGACTEDDTETVGNISMRLRSQLIEDYVLYTVIVNGDGVPVENYQVEVNLPKALSYIDDTTWLDNTVIKNPKHANGQLIFELGNQTGEWQHQLTFKVKPSVDQFGIYDTAVHASYDVKNQGKQTTPNLINTYEASLTGKHYRTFTYWPRFKTMDATLQESDMKDIDGLKKVLANEVVNHVTVTGHSDSRPIHGGKNSAFASNNELSKARAQAIADYLVKILSVDHENIAVIGKGDAEPVSDNKTDEGRQQNRRVEMLIEVLSSEDYRHSSIILGEESFIAGGVYNSAVYKQHKETKESIGLPGVRIMMEDGRFVDTDEEGRYHLEGLKPGTHVIQLDPLTIPKDYEPYLCDNNTRFAGTPTSHFVDIQKGLIWRSNFHLRRLTKNTTFETGLKLTSALEGNVVHYKIAVLGSAIKDTDLSIMLELPDAISLDKNSITSEGKPLVVVKEGKQWRIDLSPDDNGWHQDVEFTAQLDTSRISEYTAAAHLQIKRQDEVLQQTHPVTNSVKVGQSTSKAERYDFGTHFEPASTSLTSVDINTLNDMAFLFRDKNIEKIEIIGHTDNLLLFGEAKETIKNNDNLSQLRAEEIGRYLAEKLHLDKDKIVAIGMGDKKAIASNYTDEGRAKNRRVEMYVQTKEKNAPVTLVLSKPESIQQEQKFEIVDKPDIEKTAVQKAAPVAEAAGILSIKNGDVIAGSTSSIRINLDARLAQQLYIDDREIPDSRIGFRQTDPKINKTIYTYFGVNMGEVGEHELHLKGVDPFGNVRFEQKVKYTRSGEIKAIRFINAEGNIADGKTPVVAHVELIDENGKTINAGTDLLIMDGELQPFVGSVENIIPLVKDSNKMATVNNDGTIQFKPVTKSGLYRMKVQYNNVEAELKIYVKPEYRDWVMVGLADGTVGYDDVSGNMKNLADNDIEEEYYGDGKLAFYAKGRVLGKYLLTVAFDSSKKNNQDERLLQMINPDEYYTLYGDKTEQFYDAASKEKLYLRLDADNFYALFGDYNTQLSVTKLSRYDRSLTGAKGVYESEHVSVNAFAAQTNQSFARDEILGDGTSGLYHLSHKNVVVNSEKIVLQTRDRFHSERIISEQQLNRFGDYNLDYADGSLYFKQPIARHDENFNPVYIVVEYETHGSGKETLVSGGRAAVKMADEKVELGVTHIDEGTQAAEGKLTGVDARFDITKTLQLKAEYATTDKIELAAPVSADAYLAELTQKAEKFEYSIYMLEQEAGFGLGQLNQSEVGMHKYGVKGTTIVNKDMEVDADIGHEDNLVDDGQRNLFTSKFVYSPDDWEFELGGQVADDTDLTGKKFQSEILSTGVARKMLDDKLRVFERSEWQLKTDSENVDYPERHIIGSDYLINDAIDIYAEHEFTNSDIIGSEATRAGLRSRPWANATMNNGVEYDTTDIDARAFAVFGLTQAVPISDNWRASFSYDETKTLNRKLYTRVNETIPVASGTTNTPLSTNGSIDEDFWATTAGIGFQSGVYIFDSRAEYRETDTQSKYGLITGWQRNLVDGVGHALRFETFVTDDKVVGKQSDSELRYSAAIRPLGSDIFWFNRTELKHIEGNSSLATTLTANKADKLVEHLAINYLPTVDWQIATHMGYKLTRSYLGSSVFTTNTYLLGNEMRYDLTPRWDIGGHYHIITTPETGVTQDSYGFSVGVDVAKNLWLSMGFNVEGYNDDDFDANGYTAQGPYMKLRFKFDQDTFNLN